MGAPDLAQARDLAAQIADHLPPAPASIVRTAAKLLEHARQVMDGESADVGAALAELPAHALGSLVSERRQAAGLSLRDVARRTGLSINTVRDVERGHRTPAAQTVARLVTVGELGLDGGGSPVAVTDPHRPHAHFMPKYDRPALIEEMAQTLNANGGRLEQTCLYLDDQSANDWLAICSATSFAEKYRAFPFAAVVSGALRAIEGRGLDVIALGPGDGRSEVQLCAELLSARPGLDLNLYLLDVSHSLLLRAFHRAGAELGQAVHVEALHGDFRHMGRYSVLLPSRAPHRRRCYVLLGNTLANVDSEVLFLRDCLSLAAPGDLAVIDFGLTYADPSAPEKVRAADPVLSGQIPDLHARWFSGPLKRHAQGVDSFTLGVDLHTDGGIPGSYELDFFADATRGRTVQRYHLARARRYNERALLDVFARYGWATELCLPHGPGKHAAVALLRRT